MHQRRLRRYTKSKKNNQAIDKLFLLEKEMAQKGYDDVFLALMGHDNEKVRLSAAAACLQFNTYSDKAIEILKNIQYSSDSTYRFEAEMILKTNNVQ